MKGRRAGGREEAALRGVTEGTSAEGDDNCERFPVVKDTVGGRGRLLSGGGTGQEWEGGRRSEVSKSEGRKEEGKEGGSREAASDEAWKMRTGRGSERKEWQSMKRKSIEKGCMEKKIMNLKANLPVFPVSYGGCYKI